MRITHDMLVELEACPRDLAIFDREWPKGAGITRKNCLRAAELGLGITWLACEVLRGAARNDYFMAEGKAWKEYKAWKVYRKAMAIAFWRAATDRRSK